MALGGSIGDGIHGAVGLFGDGAGDETKPREIGTDAKSPAPSTARAFLWLLKPVRLSVGEMSGELDKNTAAKASLAAEKGYLASTWCLQCDC